MVVGDMALRITALRVKLRLRRRVRVERGRLSVGARREAENDEQEAAAADEKSCGGAITGSSFN